VLTHTLEGACSLLLKLYCQSWRTSQGLMLRQSCTLENW